MKAVAAIALCIALSIICAPLAHPGGQPKEDSAATKHASPTSDQLHFVSVLKIRGEVVAVDHPNLLVTVKGPTGKTSTLQARSERIWRGLRKVIMY